MNEAVQHELEHQQKLISAFGQLDRSLRKRVGYDLRVPMESSVTSLMVMPVLRALGWRSVAEEGHVEVYCEYKSRVIQADAAILSADGLPRVLIEVKRPGLDPKLADRRGYARRQLWGYAYEACRLHAPLSSVVLTNGRLWRVWQVSRATGSVDQKALDIDIGDPGTWSRFEVLARENVVRGFGPVGATDPAWPTAPEGAWEDVGWKREKERFPKVYERGAGVPLVIAEGWNPGVQQRYGKAHGGSSAGLRAKKCVHCGRDERLGHTCDGSLPQGWQYRTR